jgi:hypothetical protein
MRKLFLIGFCAAGLALATAAETYHVTLPDAMIVNGTLLPAGPYTVRVEGGKAVFQHGKDKAEAPVKVEQAPKKFASTIFKSDNTGHGLQLSEIRIGGAKTRLLFQAN